MGLSPNCEVTDVEVNEVAQCVQSRPVVSPSEEWSAIAKHKERIAEWLGRKRPLRLTKVHTLLVREHGLESSYDTLLRFARQELGWRKRSPTVRLGRSTGGSGGSGRLRQGGLASIPRSPSSSVALSAPPALDRRLQPDPSFDVPVLANAEEEDPVEDRLDSLV